MHAHLLLFLFHLGCSMAAWNSESVSDCDPAMYPNDGDGYCTGRQDGWDSWGAVVEVDGYGKGKCHKAGVGQCKCKDCGSAMTVCVDYRCNDDTGHSKYNRATQEWECFTAGTNTPMETETYDFCFSHRSDCDKSICSRGQYLSGCKRASAGACVNCPVAAVAGTNFWGAVGYGVASCTLIPCTVPTAGQFIKAACTSNIDAVIRSCAEYPGNKQSTKNMSPEQQSQINAGAQGVFDVDRFYCPAGNVVLPLPANSVTVDYASFECKPGFYLMDGSCLPCTPGSACMFGLQVPCPVNYYSKSSFATFCSPCTKSCPRNRRPLRCKEGSTFDGGCVGCGACGYSEDTGLACVENSYELQALKDKCWPSSTGAWECK